MKVHANRTKRKNAKGNRRRAVVLKHDLESGPVRGPKGKGGKGGILGAFREFVRGRLKVRARRPGKGEIFFPKCFEDKVSPKGVILKVGKAPGKRKRHSGPNLVKATPRV